MDKTRLATTLLERVLAHRAHWAVERLKPWLQSTDNLLDIGSGDGRLDQLIQQEIGCRVTLVDVEDANTTTLPLVLFDGKALPFQDNTFDISLLIFVLHHCKDPVLLLNEVKRVTRRSIVILEDNNESWLDRLVFHASHLVYRWAVGLDLPRHTLRPRQWSLLSDRVGLQEVQRLAVGRSLGWLACRHIQFVWNCPPSEPQACDS